MLKQIIKLVTDAALLLRAYALWVAALLLLAGGGVAFAQGDVFPTIDPTGWGESFYKFGAFLLLAIAAIKKATDEWRAKQQRPNLLTKITGNPWFWRGLALLLGMGGAFGLAGARYGAELVLFGLVWPWTTVLFGLASTVVAVGGYDILKKFFGLIGGAGQPTYTPNAVPAFPGLPAPPSGFEDSSTLPTGFVPDAQPLGLFGAAAIGSALVEATLGALLEGVLKQLNLPATADNVARLAVKLIKVFPDLADGNFHLNWRNRADILEASHELMDMGGLK